jgi:hypothetical protein
MIVGGLLVIIIFGLSAAGVTLVALRARKEP